MVNKGEEKTPNGKGRMKNEARKTMNEGWFKMVNADVSGLISQPANVALTEEEEGISKTNS
jgi:hypothetical protein